MRACVRIHSYLCALQVDGRDGAVRHVLGDLLSPRHAAGTYPYLPPQTKPPQSHDARCFESVFGRDVRVCALVRGMSTAGMRQPDGDHYLELWNLVFMEMNRCGPIKHDRTEYLR